MLLCSPRTMASSFQRHDDAGAIINNDDDNNKRQGTISSARYNLLSSMVGGGCLSLPLAFHQTGNLFLAPLLLVITSLLAQQSIIFLVKAGVYSSTSSSTRSGDDTPEESVDNTVNVVNRKGSATYENVAYQAFGHRARTLAIFLVCACCFAATVGYAVLLRDMLEPIVDAIIKPAQGVGGGPTMARNCAMLLVVLCVTPLTSWNNLTALKDVGAASMISVLIVGACVAYRSLECQMGALEKNEAAGTAAAASSSSSDNMRAFPLSMKELLDAIPLFISSYICHFNVLPIHNELMCPTSDRVKTWIRTSIWPATLFYYVIGFTGSLFVKCTASKSVQGNILLDFNEDDPLLLLGRLCLAVTITLAFPVLIIPPRDILVRLVVKSGLGRRWIQRKTSNFGDAANVPIDISDSEHSLTTIEFQPIDSDLTMQTSMEEPLLVLEDQLTTGIMHDDNLSVSYEYFDGMSVGSRRQTMVMSEDEEDNIFIRKIVAFTIFWSAAALACSVKSIDVVWDLVGSSFSIMLAFLIPCGAYLKLTSRVSDGIGFRQPRTVARIMILVFVPLMLISTMNAVYNSFFR